MAKLIKVSKEGISNQKLEKVEPENKTNFNLKELYKLIDCDTIEVVYLSNGDLMIIDENGKLLEKRYNDYATNILRTNNPENRDFIVGDALICSSSELK
tara:strand:+ start:145 stop:441 length:297 start_codon:yes stop_codon:yes gene_type:complete